MNIVDLPNEILLIIFEKLDMIDVLYSLVDVNQRFDQIASDLNIGDLKMINIMTINSFYNHSYSIDPKVITRICDQILFRIADQIHKLTVEQDSMRQILGCCSYPEVDSLTLINCEEEILYQDLKEDLNLRDILEKQIININIDIKMGTKQHSQTVSKIFALILSLCKNLTVLNFCDIFRTRRYMTSLFLHLPSTGYMSSSLRKLQIYVETFVDCLYVLDVRFQSLSILIIDVGQIFETVIDRRLSEKLPKLKCFSLSCSQMTDDYDTLIVQLLCRMINVEELKLYLSVFRCDSTYIDSIQLYNQFLFSMTQLNKFTFSINTLVSNIDLAIDLQSNEDIQRNFIGKYYQQVGSYVYKKSNGIGNKCHIYSLPYDFEYFIDLNNGFQGGIFDKVRYLTMYDTIPFEQQIIKLICQCFPFVEYLSITNCKPLEDKQLSSTLVTFSCLTSLDIKNAHIDYAEEFLLKKNAHLPRLLNLRMEYLSLTKITNNFTTNTTHLNFETLKSLDLCQLFVRPQNFHQYFPLL